jgi:hypothetical protein
LNQFKITSNNRNLYFNENLNSMCTFLSNLIQKLKNGDNEKKEINDEFENKYSEISYDYLLSLSAEDRWNLIEKNLEFIQKKSGNNGDLYLKKINEIKMCSNFLREIDRINHKMMNTPIVFLNFPLFK